MGLESIKFLFRHKSILCKPLFFLLFFGIIITNSLAFQKECLDTFSCKKTSTLTEVPSLLSPVNSSTVYDDLILFSWEEVEGAIEYHFQLTLDPTFTVVAVNITRDETEVILTPFNATLTEGVYYWRVRAHFYTTIGSWSSVGSFTLDLTTPMLVIESPHNQTYLNDRIYVILSENNTDFLWYYIQGIDPDNHTYTWETTRILPDGTYTLHAYGNNSLGTLVYTNVTFTIELNITGSPRLHHPVNGSTIYSSNVLFSWEEVEGAFEYDFQFSPDPTFTVVAVNTTCYSTLITLSTDNVTLTNDVYYWRVRALYYTTIGSWSSVGSFTLDITTPILVIKSPQSRTYSFDWIYVLLSTNNTDFLWYYIQGIDQQNHSYSGRRTRILPDGTYILHAYGNNSFGNLAYASVIFTIEVNTTGFPRLHHPVNGSTIYNNNVIFAWEEVEGAIGYHFQFTPDPTFTLVDVNLTCSATQVILTPFNTTLTDGVYYWRVRALYYITIGAWSSVGAFTLDTTTPILAIESPHNQTYSNDRIYVLLSGSNTDLLWYYIQGMDPENHTYTGETSRILPEGTYTLHAYGSNSFGHLAYANVTFTILITGTTTTTTTPTTTTSYTTSTTEETSVETTETEELTGTTTITTTTTLPEITSSIGIFLVLEILTFLVVIRRYRKRKKIGR